MENFNYDRKNTIIPYTMNDDANEACDNGVAQVLLVREGKQTKRLIKHLTYRMMGHPSFIRRIEWRHLLEYLHPKKDEWILDVACGCGELSAKIADHGCKVYGIDLSENEIKCAKHLAERERTVCEFWVGNAEYLPYSDGCFNKVVCSSSLEHFRDDRKALKEMNRVLKVNGKLVLTTDSFTYPISDYLKRLHKAIDCVVNYYTKERLSERLEIAGFEVTRNTYLLNSRLTSFFFGIGIKIRWSRRLWIMISLVAHPLCLISEELFGAEDKGFTLLVEAEKVNSSRESPKAISWP